MAHVHQQVQLPTEDQQGIRKGAAFIIGGLTSGHGVFHWFNQSFITMVPVVQASFGLSGIQVGAIGAVRELASGLVALPGGVVTDMVRRYWGLVLACCMVGFGIGWLIVGFSPIYPLLLVGMALVAASTSIWHLPATSALSRQFAHRRGSVLSIHGVGGNVGDVAAPVVTGALLGVFAWQEIISIYAVIPLFLAFLVFWAFRDLGRTGTQDEGRNLSGQIEQTRILLKNPKIWGITVVAGLRGMAFTSFILFLPLYLRDEFNFSPLAWGAHLALIQLVGIISTPVMGYLSDRVGRRTILIPGMLWLCILTVLLVPFGQGIGLLVILALLGTFLFSDQPILTAAALDIAGGRVAATTLGVMSISRFGMSAGSTLIAGYLYDGPGREFIFYYIAGLFALGAIILLFISVPKAPEVVPESGQAHDHGNGHEQPHRH